ncbi:alpha/beta hydrolase [Flavobacterium sp. xlx-214]|uniref:alpha/beta hydrolase n=1 Tax=unclassified Flavobacterium TaxID=196869 RepID=UPI0013D4075E|nr:MULTISPECIES: alpha/beta hydrolase [unclassified Flavobacterium]MBA5791786.1 alpha/beta hydrolase [Flavobacterium sp. xlx-221]QMI83025.1 alpha/beta hydrolase [Flavobacterium sp. xlx-214]
MKFILIFIFLITTQFIKAQNKRFIPEYESAILNQERFDKIDVNAYNETEKIHLYGTLLMPKETFEKVVMIVPGSGEDSRENHFKLTEELLLNNIAVFRYDDRGVSESEGTFQEVRLTVNELGEDMAVIFQKLKQLPAIKDKKIGLIGHSMGGMLTVDGVQKNKIQPDFMVQWATPVQSFGEIFKYQLKNGLSGLPQQFKYGNLEDAYQIMDIFNKTLATTKDTTTLKQDIELLKKARKMAKKQGYTQKRYERFSYATFPSQKAIIKKDFEQMYTNLTIPSLYIIGTNDIFVDPVGEVEKLKSLQNKNIEIKVFEGLNHYLTAEPEVKLGKEIYNIDGKASSSIVNWIKSL